MSFDQPTPFSFITPPPVPPRKSWVSRHKVATGFGGFMAVFLAIGAIGSATSTGATKSSTAGSSTSASSAAKAATKAASSELKANNGQTPAQVTAGFCKSIATQMTSYGLAGAEGNIATQAESAQLTGDIASVVNVVHKVGNDADVTAAGIEGVHQLPDLDSKVQADYAALNADLLMLSRTASTTYTSSDFPTFTAVNGVLTSSVQTFQTDCEG
jgi:hypothetical protein